MAKELAKQYDPKDVEDRIYKSWLDVGNAALAEKVCLQSGVVIVFVCECG